MRLPRSIPLALATAMVACVQTAALAQTSGYHLIGVAPGGENSGVGAICANGQFVAGTTSSQNPPFSTFSPFVWSESSGRYDLWPTEPTSRLAAPRGLSDDGSVIAGTSGDQRAFRWTGPGTFQRLGTLPTHDFTAGNGISGDGSIVVGRAWSNLSTRGEAWRWTQDGGLQGLGFVFPGQNYSEANAISRDGNVIVGMSQGGNSIPFAWTAATGMRVLPLLPGVTTGTASGTNHDGSRIVGFSYPSETGIRTAALWVGDSIQLLTAPPGLRSWATDLSDDASVILGTLSTNDGTQPAIWTVTQGWQSPDNYFSSQGFPVPAGWSVAGVDCLSADGRTFAGVLSNGDPTQGRAFVLTVPAPGTIALVCGTLVSLNRRNRR